MWHQQIHFNEESEKNYIFICIVKRWQNPRLCFYTMLINNNEHTHSLAHIFTWQKECNQSNRAHYLFKCFSSGILLSDFHISASVSSVFCLLAPVVDFMIMWNISIDVCVCMHNEKTSNRNLSPDYRHENGVYLIFLFVVSVCAVFFYLVIIRLRFRFRQEKLTFSILDDVVSIKYTYSLFCMMIPAPGL